MLYTGFKDKNSNRIYQGDAVRDKDDDFTGKVVWSKQLLSWLVVCAEVSCSDWWLLEDILVSPDWDIEIIEETGIIMSGDHPRLVLEKIKTMTRRTAGLNKINKNPDDWEVVGSDKAVWFFRQKSNPNTDSLIIKCPYGKVGDRLWVRETWWLPSYLPSDDKEELKSLLVYRAEGNFGSHGWRPSILMPKWAARIWLEITEVRAEKLQEISELDAAKEGCSTDWSDYPMTNVGAFNRLWDSLNAKRGHGWDRNDWVWPISFKLLTER